MTAVVPDIAPSALATLKKYGFGLGDHALAGDPVQDWWALLESQGGVCGVCGKVPNPSKSTGTIRFVTDHEHVRGWKRMPPERRRGYVRGLTCWWCNSTFLGRGLTLDIAKGVVRYLERYLERRPS